MQTNLNFIALNTLDLEAARQFYTETLGFEVASERPGAVILASSGGPDIGLRQVQDATPPAGTSLWLHVPDLAAYRHQLEAGGVTPTPTEPSPFGPLFRVTTRDGHVLTFHQLP